MRANFPPFTRLADVVTESVHRPADGARDPVHKLSPLKVSDREAKLRTLKHYLYHAGLLVDELTADERKASGV